jgi:plasmid replication initiation protein
MATKKTALVVKSNQLIEASYRLDLIEQRIILAAIVEARESQLGLGDDFITLEAKHFVEAFGMQGANVYQQLKSGLDTLFNRFIVVRDIHPESGNERVSKVRWISTASYIDGEGKIQIRFSTDMVPYITRLEREFTSYRLEKIGKLSSAHAVRLYELLVQYLNIGSREVELAWLKETLGLVAEYTSIKDFKKPVLDSSISQINEHTDIILSYTQRKTGRAITHIIFDIKPKPIPKQEKKKTQTEEKQPKIDKAYVEKNAYPGETWDQAYRRLIEARGQRQLPI